MHNGSFPRELKPAEQDLLFWLLPEDRPGYREYRSLLREWKVVAQGRRGNGNYIVASLDERPDNESPLPTVIAYGVVETEDGEVSVTVRERLGNQVEFEIAALGKGDEYNLRTERRRWTFSTWLPGKPCPKCGSPTREVGMETTAERRLVLGVCAQDKRLWVYDGETGMNIPIPITNFYNELMAHKQIRDPAVALNPKLLFERQDEFNDSDLINAFRTYNQLRTKVPLEAAIKAPTKEQRSLLKRVMSRLRSRHDEG